MNNRIRLNFKGPLAIKDYFEIDSDKVTVKIKDNMEKIAISRNMHGFYIWGHLHTNVFIPYYVGEIHSTGILERIKEHIRSIIKHDSTMTRFSHDYLYGLNGITPFYKDDLFPADSEYANRTELPKWFAANIKHFSERVSYLNNEEFLREIKGVTAPKFKKSVGYPISNLSINRAKEDSLIAGLDNMQFVFAEHRDNIPLFEKIEGYVKYSLKGRTTGFSDKLANIEARLQAEKVMIEIACQESLSYIFKNEPSGTEFPGY